MTARNPIGPASGVPAGMPARAMACLLAALSLVAPALAASVKEDTLKSALIYKLTKFIDWPESALEQRDAFTFCYTAANNLGGELEKLQGRISHGLPIRLRQVRLDALEDAGCDLLFTGRTALREGLVLKDVLLIGDDKGFAVAGGHIEIRRTGKRFNFVINLEVARNGGFAIDAPLLQQSTVIKE